MLSVKDWFEADKLSDNELREILKRAPLDRVSVKNVPPMNRLHNDRSNGEFFLLVQTPENRLAILCVHNFQFKQLSFWCRPRPTQP